MDNETLKKLQKVEIEILDEVVRICEKYNLKYWLVGGTLLGAVRHKGFIPWDDDIDIAMPRDDYEIFIKKASIDLDKKYFLHYFSNDKKYYLNFLKIKKKNTFFDEKLIENIDTKKNIFIDIFPYDKVKNPDSKIFVIKNYICKNLTQIIFYKRGIFTKKDLNRPILRIILFPFSYRFLLKLQNKISRLENKNKNCKYIHSYSGSYPFRKEVMLMEKIFPLGKIKFEGKMYNSPKCSEYYLKKIYGNYMKLPPESERVSHRPKKILFELEEDSDE